MEEKLTFILDGKIDRRVATRTAVLPTLRKILFKKNPRKIHTSYFILLTENQQL